MEKIEPLNFTKFITAKLWNDSMCFKLIHHIAQFIYLEYLHLFGFEFKFKYEYMHSTMYFILVKDQIITPTRGVLHPNKNHQVKLNIITLSRNTMKNLQPLQILWPH